MSEIEHQKNVGLKSVTQPTRLRQMRLTQTFSTVAIIESLPDNEYKTGYKLSEELDKLNKNEKIGVQIKFYNIKTKQDFLAVINELIYDAIEFEFFPFLHIDTHGSKEGLFLSTNEFITWSEIKEPLMKLNEATKNNLIVTLAACNGFFLAEILSVVDKTPCLLIIGPAHKMYADTLYRNYKDFYFELLRTCDGDCALRLLNSNFSPLEKYSIISAEFMFKLVFSGYIEKYCSDEMIEKRALKVQKEAYDKFGNVPERLNEIIKGLSDTRGAFKKYKKHFLMIDQFPENADRFKITYEDCLESGEKL